MFSWLDRQHVFVIHLKLCNSSEDSEYCKRFGKHALANSNGAKLVLNLEEHILEKANHKIVQTINFNAFVKSNLESTIQEIIQQGAALGKTDVRIGLMGLWFVTHFIYIYLNFTPQRTESSLTYLAYDLKTRYNLQNVATCSALTAGRSRLSHFNALTQLQSMLNVSLFDSINAFQKWLIPCGIEVEKNVLKCLLDIKIEGLDSNIKLSDIDHSIIW